MKVSDTPLAGVRLIEPDQHVDSRGFFMETWNERDYARAGIDAHFVQDNHSGSLRGTLRGLHYQVRRPQGKLVRVVGGAVYDVVVDLRRSSPGFRQWYGVELSAANRLQLWIPPGFAHGFYALSEQAAVAYKCTDYYAPQDERTLLWNDPTIAVRWPLLADVPLLLSGRDAAGSLVQQLETPE